MAIAMCQQASQRWIITRVGNNFWHYTYLMSPKQKETIVWVVLMGRMGTAPFCSMIPIIVIFYYHVLPFWVLPSSSTNKEKEFQHVQFLLQPDNVSITLLEKYYYILLRIDIWLASILGQGSLCMNKAMK